jgi:hypothetical protein
VQRHLHTQRSHIIRLPGTNTTFNSGHCAFGTRKANHCGLRQLQQKLLAMCAAKALELAR